MVVAPFLLTNQSNRAERERNTLFVNNNTPNPVGSLGGGLHTKQAKQQTPNQMGGHWGTFWAEGEYGHLGCAGSH